jgi:hypothetical protein
MANFITLTRVFKNKGKNGLVEQTVSIRADAIDMVRASNRLGYPAHRSTITLRSGATVELADKASAVNAALARLR